MNKESNPMLVIVGGFLGAGKTTLILKAADLLKREGKRAAVILNDQDAGLVDTRHAMARDVNAREVADGCFCCRFSQFVKMAGELAALEPDVIFAEPVGSCIDLSATVIRPLQTMYRDSLRVAPLTVLLDPLTASSLRKEAFDADMQFLITHQLAEADIVCSTKQDLYSSPSDSRIPIDFHLSGVTGFGVNDWLKEVLTTTRIVGAHLLDVDYTRYADAEAALGWLNVHASIQLATPRSPALLCGPILDQIVRATSAADIEIAHLKIFDRAASGWVKASVSANGAEPIPEGDLMADAAIDHEFALNLRAVGDPERLRELVLAALGEIEGRVEIRHLRAFRPPAPKPEFRMAAGSA